MSILATTQLEVTDCCVCGTQFAVPARMLASRRETGGGIHCPNGHSLTWADTELKKIRRELAAEQQRANTARAKLAETEAEKARLEAAKSRLEKRAKHGVCPCCKRTVKQLAAHMKSKHPGYGAAP